MNRKVEIAKRKGQETTATWIILLHKMGKVKLPLIARSQFGGETLIRHSSEFFFLVNYAFLFHSD